MLTYKRAAARRAVLGSRFAEGALRRDPHPDLPHRRLVRRLPRQRPAHARAREGAGEGDRSGRGRTPGRTSLPASPDGVAPRGRALVRPVAEGPRHRDHGRAALRRVRARLAPAGPVPRERARANGAARTAGRSRASASAPLYPQTIARSATPRPTATTHRAALRARRSASRPAAGHVVGRRRARPAADRCLQPGLRHRAARREDLEILGLPRAHAAGRRPTRRSPTGSCGSRTSRPTAR